MTFMAINPATGEAIATYAETSSGQVARIIERAHQAHLGWRGAPGAERAARLTALGALLRERASRDQELSGELKNLGLL